MGLLTLNKDVVIDNAAELGGGLYNEPSASIIATDSQVDGNEVTMDGGGIYNDGEMVFSKGRLQNNVADLAGAVYNGGTGRMGIVEVTINNNSAGTSGGGLFNRGKLTLNRSTVADNNTSTIAGVGGGIYVVGTGQLTMTNSTVSSNSALWGGGVANKGLSTVNNSTLSDNSASFGAGLMNFSAGQLYLSNSIIANSQVGDDCFNNGGTIAINSHNLVEDGSCDQPAPGGDPKLEPLEDNGGETWTQAIPIESPATNHGDNATCEATDQRGVSRPQNGTCDIGAYELTGGTSVYLPMVIKQ